MGDEENKYHLDLSQLHPLTHWVGTRVCRESYGGPWHHLSLRWSFHWSEWLLWPVYRVFRCPFGKHDDLPEGSRDRGYTVRCGYCSHERPATATEIRKLQQVEDAITRMGEAMRRERLRRDEGE